MSKKYFITGLVILLPLALTLAIVVFIFNLLTTPFLGFVKTIFDRYQLFESGFLFLSPDQFQNLIAQILILTSLVAVTIGLGFIARWFFFRSLIRLTEYILRTIPIVRSIYRTSEEVIKTIFTSKTNSFKQVVAVRFPHQDTYSIGLVTRENIPSLKETRHEDVVAVFVPTTPNPTSGFLVMYKPSDLIYLDMKVEDAFKYIISCGVILPSFTAMRPEEIKLPNGTDTDEVI